MLFAGASQLLELLSFEICNPINILQITCLHKSDENIYNETLLKPQTNNNRGI